MLGYDALRVCNASGGGGDRLRPFDRDIEELNELADEEDDIEEDGDVPGDMAGCVGGYACAATAVSMGLGIGVLEPDGITVVAPELIDFGSPDSRLASLECERVIGRGFSIS